MTELPPEELNFEQALAELDLVVRDLEDGKLGLEESLSRYERGVGLIKRCYTQLQQVEQKIALLTGTDGEGAPILKPFEHAATADASKLDPKRRRKTTQDPEMPFDP